MLWPAATTSENCNTITHSQRCEMNSLQPDFRSSISRRAACRRRGLSADSRHQYRRDAETRRIDRNRRAAAEQRHRNAGARGAERKGAAARGAEQRVGRLQFLRLDDLRNETHQRRLVKRQRHAVAHHQRHHQRHVRVFRDERDRHRRLTAHREHIGRHHHAAPRHAVGHDAAEQQHRRSAPRSGTQPPNRCRAPNRSRAARRMPLRSAPSTCRTTRPCAPQTVLRSRDRAAVPLRRGIADDSQWV